MHLGGKGSSGRHTRNRDGLSVHIVALYKGAALILADKSSSENYVRKVNIGNKTIIINDQTQMFTEWGCSKNPIDQTQR